MILEKPKSWHATQQIYKNKKGKTYNNRKYRMSMKSFAMYTV